MEKFCVFCGKKPSNKNKEHIIPKWLIKLTGELNREIKVGINWNSETLEPRVFRFSSYTFPACKICNDNFGKLEAQAKSVFLKLIKEEPISAVEINTLLDWFDKIRIGLWLSGLILNKNYKGLKPHFYIKDRIRLADRALVIYKNNNEPKGISFIGTDGPIFHSMPSAFGIKINELYFVNISSPFFMHKEFGLPYSDHTEIDSVSELLTQTFEEGTEKLKFPEFIKFFPKSNITFIQAIKTPFTSREHDKELYVSDYDKLFFSNLDKKFSSIYCISDQNINKVVDSQVDTYKLPDKNYPFSLQLKLGFELLEFQLYFYKNSISKGVTGERVKEAQKCIKDNILVHKTIQKVYKRQVDNLISEEVRNITRAINTDNSLRVFLR